MDVILLGTGSPLPDPDRAGPSTLVTAGTTHLLIDAGRGVLMRAAAAGVMAGQLSAVLLTHLHSDHITDLGDVITSRWITSVAPAPLPIVGPPGTRQVVESILASLSHDIGYRIAHHDDLTWEPPVEIHEVTESVCPISGEVRIVTGLTDHRPVTPSIGFRLEHLGQTVVVAGDTVPCASLDALCAGADAIVHTALRKDLIEQLPIPRLQDVLDYHSSVEQAAQTAARANAATLILTDYVPPLTPQATEEWRALAAAHFDGRIELGDDLHRVTIGAASRGEMN